MKKYFLMLAVALATGMVFTSCGDDDDEGGGGGSFSGKSTAGQLDDGMGSDALPEGYRISAVKYSNSSYNDYLNSSYLYDEKGNLKQIYVDGEYLEINGNTISKDYDDEDGEINATLTLSTNNKGNITKMVLKLFGNAYGFKVSGGGTTTFSYNSNQQLTNVSLNYKASAGPESLTESGEVKLSYNGSILQRITKTSKYVEAGSDGKYQGNETSTNLMQYDKEADNVYYQWTPRIVSEIRLGEMEDFFSAFAFLGMLGRSSSVLPSSFLHAWTQHDIDRHGDPDDDEGEGTYNCSYSFNAYGAIRKADGYDYSYTTITPDYDVKATRAAEEDVLKPFVQKEESCIGRFFRCHRK